MLDKISINGLFKVPDMVRATVRVEERSQMMDAYYTLKKVPNIQILKMNS